MLEDKGAIGSGQGEYYHTAMFDYMSNYYSEMVSLERIQREMGRAVTAGATRWLLSNTANVRPVVMTTRAVMELAWNPKPWVGAQPQGDAEYLKRWSREEFGERAAEAVEDYYKAYFAAPAQYGEAEDARAADNYYETVARRLLLALVDGFASHLLAASQAAEPRWAHARALAMKALAPADRQEFFQANILTQVDLHLHFNRIIVKLTEMAQAEDKAAQIARLKEAIAECEAAQRALDSADYGKWKNFYTAGDWLLNTRLTLDLERAYLDHLEGRTVDLDVVTRARDTGFAYHMITAYQGTQTVFGVPSN